MPRSPTAGSARIAVVEDSQLIRSYMSDILAEAGHQVDSFASAEDCLAAPDLAAYDVVVTDLIMDGIGGQGLIEALRDRGHNTEIVVATMMADAESAVRAMRSGAFDYLVKPVNPEVLALTVSRCLEKRRLLQQNHRLQRDLELALAGQRLLACDSAERIAETTLAALRTFLDLDAGLVEAAGSALCIHNLEATRAEIALGLAAEQGRDSFGPCTAPDSLADLGPLYVAALGEGEETLQVLVARPRSAAMPDEDDLADANFLLRHAHNALVNERVYARARDEALRDSLTGLYNARYFQETLGRAIESGQFNDSSLAVLFLDIDRFKQVNDTYGHLVGSKLLVELGKVLTRCVRENDLVARFGGDEFVVLLEHANAHWAEVVAERIRTAVERRPFLAREDKSLHITVCVGVACFPEHGKDVRAICDLADMAMYEGKRAERNAVHMADLQPSS